VTYRRDISSTIKLLALVLILFVGYQVWFKPTYLTPGPTLEHPSSSVALPSSPSFALPESQTNPLWDVPPSRLVDLGPAPNPTLGSIRDDLDRGNYNEVERRLKALSQKMLTNIPTRQYIAALWNNLGIQQEKFGGTALSVKALKQSVAWDPKNPPAHLNLTQAYWELRDPAMTPQFLETVIRLAPQDPFPHLALADLLLTKGRIAVAATHLEHARPRAERDPNHQSYFRRLMAKVEAIQPVRTAIGGAVQPPQATHPKVAQSPAPPAIPSPSSSLVPPTKTGAASEPPPQAPLRLPAQPGAAHFTVRFDGPPDEATWTRMRAILEYAYEELSQKFGHVPAKPITVVLHTNQKFVSVAGSPVWADRLFDRSSGAIHLPTQGALEDLALFSRIARHEFVHALLFAHLKGFNTGVPNWLVEGLAMQLAEDPWSDVEEAGQKTATLIPLTSLQGDWTQLSGDAMQIAYIEARSATQNLVDRYSMYGVRQTMNLLQTGQSLDAAMRQKLSVSYEQFQREWAQAHHSSMKSSGS
jgi:tetratricopeptide (TPR) repeat protein